MYKQEQRKAESPIERSGRRGSSGNIAGRCRFWRIPMSDNQLSARTSLEFMELREGQAAIMFVRPVCIPAKQPFLKSTRLVHRGIAHSKQKPFPSKKNLLHHSSSPHRYKAGMHFLSCGTPPTTSTTLGEHGHFRDEHRATLSSRRLAHSQTLTRSTTPSGSEMGDVPPTLLMPPPTTCGNIQAKRMK